MTTKAGPKAVVEFLLLAGGRLIGRTKFQKCMCALEIAGVGYGFAFSYRHFGPYSEDLKVAASDADALGLIEEKREVAGWGGWYSVFVVADHAAKVLHTDQNQIREKILGITGQADPIELELAITAAFLASQGVSSAWREVKLRKPDKAGRITGAKKLYKSLRDLETPRPFPAIN